MHSQPHLDGSCKDVNDLFIGWFTGEVVNAQAAKEPTEEEIILNSSPFEIEWTPAYVSTKVRKYFVGYAAVILSPP